MRCSPRSAPTPSCGRVTSARTPQKRAKFAPSNSTNSRPTPTLSSNVLSWWSADVLALVKAPATNSKRAPSRQVAVACEDVPVVVWEYAAEDASQALHARPEFLRALRATSVACTETAAEIVFNELVSNVVKHAPGPISVKFEVG